MLVDLRIFFQIGQCEFEKRCRRLRPVLLQMDERAGQLNQALVKCPVRPVLVFQPDVFENLVRLEKFLLVEQFEITGVMRVELSFAELPCHRSDAFALIAHGFKVKSNTQSLKSKVIRAGRRFGLVSEFCILHSAFTYMAKPALGRGLGALLGGSPALTQSAPATQPVVPATGSDSRDRVQRVPLDRIRPCPLQPRKDFSDEALRELADSIREQGIVQPLIVRERGGFFELIAG